MPHQETAIKKCVLWIVNTEKWGRTFVLLLWVYFSLSVDSEKEKKKGFVTRGSSKSSPPVDLYTYG